jgi:geranylgeranyl pyrophosphate synthase
MTSSPRWLSVDVERVEELLLASAGDSFHSLVSEASTHLIRAGGKRVRPALVLLASRAGETGRVATDLAAAAVELVHLATLCHDDVIDETDLRRGVPTVHSRWGVEIAVLAGDFLFARGCTLGAEAGGEVPGILARAIAEVCQGQIVETSTLGDANRSVDEYMETIRRKSATLFAAACELGASTASVESAHRTALISFGEHLGLAFQMVDDLLDLIGDPEVIGKIPGTDLREGVFTLPVLLACERDGVLRARIGEGDRDLGTVLPKLESTGALRTTLEMADSRAEAAIQCLRMLPDSEWRSALESMVDSVMSQVPGAAVA